MQTTNNDMTTTVWLSYFSRTAIIPATAKTNKLPLILKLSFTGFMAVLVPVYWHYYGPTNFLYFCDMALFITLAAVWMENKILASMAAVGILIPQLLWCADFGAHLFGSNLVGMTDYMFNPKRPLFLRGLSLFHGWLPFMLIYMVGKLGYDRRAFAGWTFLAWASMLFAYAFLPPAGAVLPNPQTPVNVNYVYGLSDSAPQTWMPSYAWLATMMGTLPVVFYLPAHLTLKRVCK
jgi:hypothetical protein